LHATRHRGLSQLRNPGLPALVSRDADDYVRIATTLARDLPRLAEMRSTLRERMERSALMDTARFTHGIEAAYRAAWRAWCKVPGAYTPEIMSPAEAFGLANQHLQHGRTAEAAALCEQILAVLPEQPDVLHLLGVAAYQLGRMQDAAGYFRRALAANPQATGSRNNLGCTLIELGHYEEAIAEYRIALLAEPLDPDQHANLADALYHAGRFAEAAAACRTALSIQPDLATAHNNLGNALRSLGQSDAAIAAYRTALRREPRYAVAQSNLGAILSDRFDHEAAVEAFRVALEWKPNSGSAHNNLGCALMNLGRFDEAVASYRRAMELMPADASFHSNLIYSLQFIPGVDARAIAEEQARWNERHAVPLRGVIRPPENGRDPNRRLRVGFVSPDLREHPISFFLAGLLDALDREQVEAHCYASIGRPDAVTERLRTAADCWHDVLTFSDEALADKIRSDGIDILVDLSMHSADNRLRVFARKPAPVQVSWLAYPGTTGLETIDFRFTDAVLEPPEAGPIAGAERPIHLPDTWCCYTPIGPAPEIGELPAARQGAITFASFSKSSRLNDALLHCWAALAARVPDARWLLLHPSGPGREQIVAAFGEHAARIEFVARQSWIGYLALLARSDVSLDSFPNNGLTATCHALWMGTPVVTLAGRTPAARAGASILTAAGLPELIATSTADYVSIAAALAADRPRLAAYRAGMRDRLRISPLMDATGFARSVEAAYRAMWQEWCARSAARESNG